MTASGTEQETDERHGMAGRTYPARPEHEGRHGAYEEQETGADAYAVEAD